jgi:hypothetical protein
MKKIKRRKSRHVWTETGKGNPSRVISRKDGTEQSCILSPRTCLGIGLSSPGARTGAVGDDVRHESESVICTQNFPIGAINRVRSKDRIVVECVMSFTLEMWCLKSGLGPAI